LQNAYGLYVFLHTFLPKKDLRFCRTETGVLFIFFPKQKPGYDWQYGRFARHVKPRFVPQEEGKAVLQVLVSISKLSAALIVIYDRANINVFAHLSRTAKHTTQLW